jgi:coenzyme F420-reducing hydrogenase alpha subunit
MPETFEIDVHHVTRIEGHGNLVLRAKDGKIEKLEWQVPEAPRFFEAMVRGRKYDEIQPVVSRICGICSITHSLASTKAVENALGVQVTPEADLLRLLTHYSEQMQSHVLHVGYLVAPDLLGVKSVVPLASTHLDIVKKIISLHRLANEWSDLLAGRTTHPTTFRVGGFNRYPSFKELVDLKKRLEAALPTYMEVVDVVLSLAGKIPDFKRDTEYIALKNPGEYTFYHGDIGSTDVKETVPVSEFERVINEYVVPQSTAKWAKWHRESYMVGAIARYNNNSNELLPIAKKVAAKFGLKPPVTNPYMNSVIQLVECAQIAERSLQILDTLLTKKPKFENVGVKVRAGNGAGCVEAPRGILFHRYVFDNNGICQSANISIPTNQNHGNIQKDIEALAPTILSKGQDQVRLLLEMLVRAYDPCVSCSTHYLDVKFV